MNKDGKIMSADLDFLEDCEMARQMFCEMIDMDYEEALDLGREEWEVTKSFLLSKATTSDPRKGEN